MTQAASSSTIRTPCETFSDTIQGGILGYQGIFRGLTYGDYIREWSRWLHSEAPVYKGYRGEICYLHGNVSYYYERDTGIRKQAEKFQNNARDKDDKIFKGSVIWTETAVFVPVLAAFYSVGERDPYHGGVLQSIEDCQFVCRRDLFEGGDLWCTLEKKDLKDNGKICTPIDLKANVFYYEAPSFKLTVSENSPLRSHVEVPIDPGTYDTFAAAKAIMLNTSNINYFPEGVYRLRYGGFGRGSYKNDTVQDFIVQPDPGWPKAIITPPGGPPDHKGEVPPL